MKINWTDANTDNDDIEDPALGEEREERFAKWYYDELDKFDRGEPAMVRREDNVVTLLFPQWQPQPDAGTRTKPNGSSGLEITVFDKSGGILTKRISLTKDGTVDSDGSACKMSEGTARRVEISGVEEFAKIIGGLRRFQGIVLGAMRDDLPDEVKVVVAAKLNGKTGVIARTRDHFEFRKGKPALAAIDFDKNGITDKVEKHIGDDVWGALTTALPALRNVARVMRRSTSSCLYNADTAMPETGGWHGYVLVKDGSDIKRFLDTLHDRCWLAGFGWFYINKAGIPYDRSIVDCGVATPEHLLFEASPKVEKPLRQDLEARRPIPYDGETLDTLLACPDLTAKEQEAVDKMKADEKERIQPEIDKARADYIDVQVEDLIKRKGISKAEALKIAESQCNGVLCAEVVLEFNDPKLKGCTVGDVLDDPERFRDKPLADPIEGAGYKSGTTCAQVKLRRDNDWPWIKSHAHGGMSYSLVHKPGDELKLDFPGRLTIEYVNKPEAQPESEEIESEETESEEIESEETESEETESEESKPSAKSSVPSLIAKWNENHAHVLAGSKSCVLQEFRTPENHIDFKLLSSASFKEWNAEFLVKIGKGKDAEWIPQTVHWLRHRQRRKYQDIGFFPKRDVPGFYNLWRGFAVEPRKGDCSKFLAHLHDNICQGDDDLFAWVEAWFADIFQRPGVKCGTSLAMRGKMGVGKTKVGEVFESLLGVHYKLVADPRFVTGRFNSHMVSLLMLFADEGFWAGDKKAEGKLKDLVTGKKHPIEFKGKDAFWVDNYVRLLVSGNEDWVVPAGFEERRFATVDVSDTHRNDYPYFAAIDEEMNNGGREALLHHLLFEVDCSKVNLRKIPHTDALVDQKLESATTEQSWWLDVLRNGILPGDWDGVGSAPSELLFDHYIEHAKKKGVSRRKIETQIGMFIKKMVGDKLHRERETYKGPPPMNTNCIRESKRGFVYYFPPLKDCRDRFAEMLDEEMQWDEDNEWASADTDLDPDGEKTCEDEKKAVVTPIKKKSFTYDD